MQVEEVSILKKYSIVLFDKKRKIIWLKSLCTIKCIFLKVFPRKIGAVVTEVVHFTYFSFVLLISMVGLDIGYPVTGVVSGVDRISDRLSVIRPNNRILRLKNVQNFQLQCN